MISRSLFVLGFFVISCTPTTPAPRSQERTGTTPITEETQDTSDDANPKDKPDEVVQTPDTPAATNTPAPTPTVEAGSLNVQWFAGAANCGQDNNAPIQVHAYNKNLTILRQNKCTNFEAPFMYLIFGAQKALLLDTGATQNLPLRTTVENLLVEHYGAAQRAQITLIVAHTHAHGDHVAGDGQFRGQAGTTVVGTGQAAVSTFFGITNFPETMADYDLGGRILKVIPIPGHEGTSLAFHDAQTGIIFTGDSLYPGRLYVQDWATYRTSMARLRTYAESKTITHVLGAHVEISKTPGQDFAFGATFQPDEHPLELKKDALILLDTELKNIGANPMRKVLDEFIISPN
ncbi:MBL fold metallo-hydrolase [Oligoflexus tunisiensis]|uniref:MBL fold metallo-hydrolase n=1 Tax=Oligoflexus tunisiensis TaxID=708132 RepID=UPI00159F2644|nr:MBL fold metallo-hydrolase [Oligoflexus tunisiensis]